MSCRILRGEAREKALQDILSKVEWFCEDDQDLDLRRIDSVESVGMFDLREVDDYRSFPSYIALSDVPGYFDIVSDGALSHRWRQYDESLVDGHILVRTIMHSTIYYKPKEPMYINRTAFLFKEDNNWFTCPVVTLEGSYKNGDLVVNPTTGVIHEVGDTAEVRHCAGFYEFFSRQEVNHFGLDTQELTPFIRVHLST